MSDIYLDNAATSFAGACGAGVPFDRIPCDGTGRLDPADIPPLIQKKAKAASKNAMTDDFVKKLQELARKDAQRGVYMDKQAYDAARAEINAAKAPTQSALSGGSRVDFHA